MLLAVAMLRTASRRTIEKRRELKRLRLLEKQASEATQPLPTPGSSPPGFGSAGPAGGPITTENPGTPDGAH